jgi:RimJ/RimL family protein N-acetyltransferase
LPKYFHLYNPPADLYGAIRNDKRFGIKYRKRVQLRFMGTKRSPSPQVTGSNRLTTEQICEGNYDQQKHFNLQLDGRFWNSKNDFLDYGYGIIVYNRKAVPVSLCYAACVVDNIAEIDIATLPEFRGKGYATLAAREFLRLSQSKSIQANWDCFVDNTFSLRIAQKLNFKEMGEYNFLSIYRI